jgi:2'-5' RNA ligase
MDTALILPVPQLDTEPVQALRARYSPSGAAGLGAHLTLVVPFLPADGIALDVLHELFDATPRFRLRFAEVRTFHRVLWLAPEPAAPVRALIQAVAVRWPETPPYGGEVAVEDVVPHLTLASRDHDEARTAVNVALAGLLPIEVTIDEAWLVEEGRDGRWHCRESFPLGASAA